MDDDQKKGMKEPTPRGFATALIKTATTYGCIQRTVDLRAALILDMSQHTPTHVHLSFSLFFCLHMYMCVYIYIYINIDVHIICRVAAILFFNEGRRNGMTNT